jgi:hypothetical protein
MFERFIDDGFGIIKGNKKDVGTWIKELISCVKTFL